MDTISILDRDIPVQFLITDLAARVDQAHILALARDMAGLIDRSGPWSEDEKEAFSCMTRIVFFQGSVMVDGYEMDRPCCDQDDAVFYWEIEEFLRNPQDDVHANTFFHDCWHVVQFRRAGNRYAYTSQEQVEREVDATTRQAIVAGKLGCSADEIDYLIRFSADPGRIRERLAEGVGNAHPNAAAPHRTGALSDVRMG